jgi:hypothetical protein
MRMMQKNPEINLMKTAVFVLCFFTTTIALGQSTGSVGGAVLASTVQMVSHPEHVSQQAMAQDQSLMEHSNYFYAQGERPLWEVQPLAHHVPLGDIARMLKQEHATAKKADIVVND